MLSIKSPDVYGIVFSHTVFQKDISFGMECSSEGKGSKNHVPQEKIKGMKHVILKTSLRKEHASNNREC